MTDMADVLRGRIFAGRELNERQIADIAAALSAAGFGPVQEARAEGWDHGHHDGAVDMMLHLENDGNKTTPNPYYRKASDG